MLILQNVLQYTVKHFLFARTLFSGKFARANRRKYKVLANYYFCTDYRRKYCESRK